MLLAAILNHGDAFENRKLVCADIGRCQLVRFFQFLKDHIHDHARKDLLLEDYLFIDQLLFDVLDVLRFKKTVD